MNIDGIIDALKMANRLEAKIKDLNFKPKGHNREIYMKSKKFRKQTSLKKK